MGSRAHRPGEGNLPPLKGALVPPCRTPGLRSLWLLLPSCPQEAQPKGLQVGGGPGSLGKGMWSPGCLSPARPHPSSHLSPTYPGPSQPLPSPSPVSCGVCSSPARPLLPVACPAVLGLGRAWHCLSGCLDPTPSSATPSGCALASAAAYPGRRSYRKGAGESLAQPHPRLE